jgi:tetratricopeptide (TPR) repeat protein
LIAIFLFFLLMPPSSLAKDNWTRIQSKNFIFVGNAGESEMRRFALRLEQFRQVIALLLPNNRLSTSVPTTVVIFKSDDSFQPFKPKYKGKTVNQVAGYFLSGADGNYIALTTETRSADPYHVIFHELTHFLVDRNIPNAPVWLNEGIAEFYSTFDTLDEGQKYRIGRPIAWHLAELQNRSTLPLKTLLTVDQRSPYYNEAGKSGIFYAESWALVHYLLLGEHGKRQAQFERFISQLNTTTSVEDNFRQSIEDDYKKLEGELRSYISRRVYPVMEYRFDKQLELNKEMQSGAMSEADVEFYKGDLLLRFGRVEEAESHLQKSIALEPNAAMSQISLGLLRLRQKQPAAAKDLFQQAIKSNPGNYLAHYYFAGALGQEGKIEEAIKSYKQALLLKPDASRVFAELSFLYYEAQREAEGDQALRQAIRHDQTDASLYLARSWAFLRAARGISAAKAALAYLLLKGWRNTHSPYMALVTYFGYRQARRTTDAAKATDAAIAKLDNTAWPYPVIKYLTHTLTEKELLAAATDNDKQTEAHTYNWFGNVSGRSQR